MVVSEYSSNIISISLIDFLVIHYLSVLWGLWSLFKQLFKKMCYNSNNCDLLCERGQPPSCLVNTSFGQHTYLKLKGVKLHYVESGRKNAPVVLLLHGFPDFWISWRHQIPILSKYYRVIALDLKGFGDSDKPSSRRCYRLDLLLNELHDLIVTIGERKCIVIGHDLGALLGWYLVHLYPQMIEKFVAISCPHPNLYWTHLPRTSSFNTNWIYYSQLPHLPETDALNNDLYIINQCYQHLSDKNIHKPYLDAYKYCFSRKEDWTGAINYYRNLPFCRIDSSKSHNGEMIKVPVPCLLMVGNQDSSVNLETVIKTTDYLEKFELKVVDGTGHFPHQEDPASVNKHLLSFLNVCVTPPSNPKEPANGLVNRVVGAMKSTVRYGGEILPVPYLRRVM